MAQLLTVQKSAEILDSLINQAISEAADSWKVARTTGEHTGHATFQEAVIANPRISSQFVWQHPKNGRWFCA